MLQYNHNPCVSHFNSRTCFSQKIDDVINKCLDLKCLMSCVREGIFQFTSTINYLT